MAQPAAQGGWGQGAGIRGGPPLIPAPWHPGNAPGRVLGERRNVAIQEQATVPATCKQSSEHARSISLFVEEEGLAGRRTLLWEWSKLRTHSTKLASKVGLRNGRQEYPSLKYQFESALTLTGPIAPAVHH